MLNWRKIDDTDELLVSYIGSLEKYLELKSKIDVRAEHITEEEISFIISQEDSIEALSLAESSEPFESKPSKTSPYKQTLKLKQKLK